MRDKKSITLGSGHLYAIDATDIVPEISAIRTENNRLGYIQGGASIEYTATWYNAKDDLGFAKKAILTEETVVLKSGIMTFNATVLKKLASTARVTEKNGTRTLKIGGVGNQDGKKYIILFYHEDKDEGDIAVLIVGQNQAGFTLAFTKDKETVIDAQFTALPMDDEGTLVEYIEYSPNQDYRLTIEAGTGGSIITGTNGQYTPGTEIAIRAEPDYEHNFDAWASSGGGAFEDASQSETMFTMPPHDVTITATFIAV